MDKYSHFYPAMPIALISQIPELRSVCVSGYNLAQDGYITGLPCRFPNIVLV